MPASGDLQLAVSTGYETNASAQKTTGHRITASFTDTNVIEALQAIAKQAGLQLIRQGNAAPVTDQVTVKISGASIADALNLITRGTSVSANITPDGSTIAVRQGSVRAATGVITGRIIHAKTKQPVNGATVTVDDAAKGVIVGADGTFRIVAEPGVHTIHVKALGFVRQRMSVTVESEKAVTVEVVLEPSASVLDEVIVTGTVVATERRAIPTPITVITAKDIEQRGITRIEQLMRGEIPGLLAIDRGSASFTDTEGIMSSTRMYSRGSASLTGEGNPIKTYVDGVELADPTFLSTIDPKSIERIEVITGPQAATIYGSGALGGVMQIFTKRGSGRVATEFSLNARYGLLQSNLGQPPAPTHDYLLSATGGIGPAFTFSSTASYNSTGQWQPGLYSRVWGGSAGFAHVNNRVTVNASASINRRENGSYRSVRSFCAMGEANNACFESVVAGADLASGELAVMSFPVISRRIHIASGQTFSVSADYRQSSAIQHHWVLGQNRIVTQAEPEAPGLYRPSDSLYRHSETRRTRQTANYHMSASTSMKWFTPVLAIGANATWADGVSNIGCTANAFESALVGCSSSQSVDVSKPLNENGWGGFGNLRLGIQNMIFLSFGLRGEASSLYGRDHRIDWTPTYGFSYVVDAQSLTVKFLASYGSATRQPLESQRREVIGRNVNYEPYSYVYFREAVQLQPERSRGPQGGIEIYYSNVASLAVNHFQQKVTDLIEAYQVDSVERTYLPTGVKSWAVVGQYFNSGVMRQKGWEGSGSLQLGPVGFKGTYSWVDSRTVRSKTWTNMNSEVGGSFFYVPTHTGNFSVSFAHRNTAVTLNTNWVGSSLRRLNISRVGMGVLNGRLPQYGLVGRLLAGVQSEAGYTKSDLVVSHQVNRVASLLLNVMNVANSTESDLGELYPTLGRQTSFGLSLRWP